MPKIPIDWYARAQRGNLDGYPEGGGTAAEIAIAHELRTLNLLLAGHLLSDDTAGEEARQRLGLGTMDGAA